MKSARERYREGADYDVLGYDSGSVRTDLPLFTSTPGVVQYDDSPETTSAARRVDIPDVPGAFLLVNALTPAVRRCRSNTSGRTHQVEPLCVESACAFNSLKVQCLSSTVGFIIKLTQSAPRLYAAECAQILVLSEAMGYTEDAPVSLGGEAGAS